MALGSLLLLLSAFLHASWNALAKSAKDKGSYLFVTMLFGGFLSLASVVIMPPEDPFAKPGVFLFGVGSGLFEGLYLLALGRTLKSNALGTSYAVMRGGAMLVVWVISLSFLGEVATISELAGAGLVLAGIFIMNPPRFFSKDVMSSAMGPWPFLSALFIAGYHVCYHQALHHGAEPRSLFTLSVLVSLPLVYGGVQGRRGPAIWQTLRSETYSVLATGFLSTLSFVIFLYGLQVAAPGFAISLRNASIFFALIFSFFMKERLSPLQVAGAALIAVGAFLLSVS